MSLAELIAAASGGSGNLRVEAENKLNEAKMTNPGMFILACSEEFAKKNLVDDLRPMAAILIKYTLLNAPNGSEELWKNLEQTIRQKTKNNILGTLAYPHDAIRNTAADLVSIIYAIEAQSNAWPDLVPNLAENANHQDVEIKKSAILALGQICDKMKQTNLLDEKMVESILMGICYSLQEGVRDDIKKIALGALHDSLPFSKSQLQKQEIRVYIIERLLENTQSLNIEILTKSLQCLIDFVKIYYDYINEYLETLCQATLKYITVPNKEIAVPVIEIFNTIATEDKERESMKSDGRNLAFNKNSLNATGKIDKLLVPALLENLLDKEKYEDNEEGGGLNIVASTKSCLTSVCEAIKDKFLDYAKLFVGEYILSNQSLHKRAALICYTCMLEGPSHDPLLFLFTKAVPEMIKLLNYDNDILVRETASTALEATAELTPGFYFQEAIFTELLAEFTKAIESPPRVSLHVAKIWHFIGEEIAKRNAEINLSEQIDILIKNAFRQDLQGYFLLIDHSLLAVMTLLHATKDDRIKEKYVVSLVSDFKKTANIGGERKSLIQSGLLACLQTLLNKCSFQNDAPAIDEIYNIVMQMFQAFHDITPDGILVLGALASAMGERFKKYSEEVWPIIAKGIQYTTQSEIFVASLGTLVELSRSCPDETARYLNDIFKLLIGLLQDTNFDKNLKVNIIITIGDISLGCKDLVTPYIPELMDIYQMAMHAATSMPTEDGNLTEYLEQLRENMLESYICFIHAVAESPNGRALVDYLEQVYEFLNLTCTEKFNPTVDYMRNALALIADMGFLFGKAVSQYVKSPLTNKLIDVLGKFTKNQDNQNIIEYALKVIHQL